jgi:hypothetical protein
MFRQSIKVESLDMRYRFRRRESWHLRDGRAGTEVEKYAVGEDGPRATVVQSNLDGARSDESRIAP